MGLDVVAWSDGIGDQVLDALGASRHWIIEQGRAVWRPATDGECWSRALVILDDGVPVAAAGAFHPMLHPTREWAYVEVSDVRRRQGLATLGLRHLRGVLPSTAKPLRAKVHAASAGGAFASHQGLTSIQRTRLIKVVAVPAGVPALDVIVSSEVDDGAVTAWRDYYAEGHSWDPPAQADGDFWRVLLAEAKNIAVVRRGDVVTGIALVLVDNDELRLVGGAVRRADPQAPLIAANLILAVANTLRSASSVELDDWMWEVDEVLCVLTTEVLDVSHVVAEAPPRR